MDFLKEYQDNSATSENQWVQHYLGSDKPTFGIKAKVVKNFCRSLIQENNLSQDQLVELLDSLYKNATTFNEIDIANKNNTHLTLRPVFQGGMPIEEMNVSNIISIFEKEIYLKEIFN